MKDFIDPYVIPSGSTSTLAKRHATAVPSGERSPATCVTRALPFGHVDGHHAIHKTRAEPQLASTQFIPTTALSRQNCLCKLDPFLLYIGRRLFFFGCSPHNKKQAANGLSRPVFCAPSHHNTMCTRGGDLRGRHWRVLIPLF